MRISAAHLLIFTYVLLTHTLLFSTSPYYRFELQRGTRAVYDAARASMRFGGVASNSNSSSGSPQLAHGGSHLPRSGVYASTDLLLTIQQHIQPHQGTGQDGAADADRHLYKTADLLAYTSATDVIRGEGWAARAAVFVAAVAPRALLLAQQHRLPRQIRLLQLASRDLPAVGPLVQNRKDPSVGYSLSCTSPALSMGLGPQPIATCSVWAPAPQENSSNHQHQQQQKQGRNLGAGQHSNDSCPAQLLVATWTILPDSSPEEVAQSLKDSGAQPQPYLGGNRFSKSEPGYVAGLIDVWLFLPRAGMLQLVPAMTSLLQQVLYAVAVLYMSYLDMLQLARTVRKLQRQAMQDMNFLGTGPWENFMTALSMLLQLLLITCVRAVVSGLAAIGAGGGVMYLLEHGTSTTPVLRSLLKPLSWVTNPRGAVAAVLTFFAVLRLQDIAFVLLWGLLCVLLIGLLFSCLVDAWGWEEELAARLSIGVSFTLLLTGNFVWFEHWGPSMVLAESAATSTSWLLRVAARATAAAAAAQSHSAATAAAAAAGSSTSRLAGAWQLLAQLLALIPGMPQWQRAWQQFSAACSSLLKDAAVLGLAVVACEELLPLGDAAWKGLVQMAGEAGVLLECAGSALSVLLAGGSWRAAWNRFCIMFEARFQQVGIEGGQGIQAQLVIQAPQAAFANVGHTADALRALADEIEDLDGPGGALQQQQLFPNGRLVLPRQHRGPKLGSHWPAPLEIDFDVDDVRGELGIDVPRGFVCPLTLDIMKQPALLISSNIAVPSSYEKEAISTWLEESRRDPKTRRVLASDAQLVPNFDLYRSIEDWVAHAQEALAAKRSQQQQTQAAAEAAAPGMRRAASAPVGQEAAGEARPTSSSGAISSLLAAARGAMVRGTAAAAVAAGGRRRRSTRAAAAAGGRRQRSAQDDPYLFPLDEAEEQQGPAAGGAARAGRGAAGRAFALPGGYNAVAAGGQHGDWEYEHHTEADGDGEDGDYVPPEDDAGELEDEEWGLGEEYSWGLDGLDTLFEEEEEEAAEDFDAVDSFSPHRQQQGRMAAAGPSSVVGGRLQGAAAAGATGAAAQQLGSPTGRYNLRRRSSASSQQ